jgi:prophage regulatory protein
MAGAVAIFRFPELHRCTGLSRSTVWRMEAAGQFPARIRLSKNSVGWNSTSVAAWQKSRQSDTIEADAAPVKMSASARAELAKKRAEKRAAPAKKRTKRHEVTASTG